MQLTQEELRKAQLLMLKILKEVHRVCEENNIKYFLSDGTLIGAIRHNGFIPWDDDLDIGMLREEYEKFCKIAPEKLGDEFVLQTTETDPGYAWQFGKVMLKNTVWLESAAKNTNRNNFGIYIDIFPYDKIPKNKILQWVILYRYRFVDGLIRIKLNYNSFKKTRGFVRKLFYLYKLFFIKIYSLKNLIRIREKICKQYLRSEKRIIVTKYGGSFKKNQNTLESYSISELRVFEDMKFYIPKAYDSILKNLYGDYMVLPPEEKRTNHGIYEYDFGIYEKDFILKEGSQ
ncbi:MAG: LicD family protein [Treponema sp.]|nr:LicD family protein [Treponema sp.]